MNTTLVLPSFNHTRISPYPKLGNGIAATRDLEPGDEIIRVNEPFLICVEKAALSLVWLFITFDLNGKLMRRRFVLSKCSPCLGKGDP